MADLSRNDARSDRLRKRLRFASAVAAALLLSTSTGCTVLPGLAQALDYSEECDEAVMGYRNSAYAAKAWYKRKPCYRNRQHLDDFGAGFRAGYEDVANGGNGCTPAFAPREYWSWKYQSPVGQQRVAAWFAGYPLGAKAAEEDGLGNYAQIMASSSIQHEYQSAGWVPPPVPMATPCGPALPVTGSPTPMEMGASKVEGTGVVPSASDVAPPSLTGIGAPTPAP